MNSKSITYTDVKQLDLQLANICEQDFQPTLAIVFSSPETDTKKLIEVFNTNNIQFIGCSSAGEIHNEKYIENSIVVLLIDPPVSSFKIFGKKYLDQQESSVAQQFAEDASNSFPNPSVFLLSSGIKRDGASIVSGIKKSFSTDIPIYGGLAGDGMAFSQTTCYNNQFTTNDGFVAIVFDNTKIKLEGKAVSGWSGIGKKSIATKTIGNVLYEIDDKPALDVFLKYFNLENFKTENEISDVTTIPGQYPLEILDNNCVRLRSILQYNQDDRSMLLAGTINQGDVFRFCNAPSFEEIENTVSAYDQFANETAKSDALILVSCKARHLAFGPLLEDEITGIKNKWQAPMIGYLSYGEIGKINNESHCDFHNSTNALITLRQIAC